MRQEQEQVQRGIQEKAIRNDIAHARKEWIRTIILNLVIAATVSLARAAIDSLVTDYRHNPREHTPDEYPF